MQCKKRNKKKIEIIKRYAKRCTLEFKLVFILYIYIDKMSHGIRIIVTYLCSRITRHIIRVYINGVIIIKKKKFLKWNNMLYEKRTVYV